jgi:hypothetical protein
MKPVLRLNAGYQKMMDNLCDLYLVLKKTNNLNKMKNIKLYIILLITIFFSGSCELDLDRIPESNLSDAAFWTTDQNFKDACNRFYVFVDGENEIVFDDLRTDYSVDRRAPNEISSGTRIVPNTSNDWNKPYQIIFIANEILKQSEGSELANIARWQAEARWWRAYAYFSLLAKYGGVPLVLRPLDISDEELYGGRAERSAVVQQIYDDLDFAALNLPTFTQLGAADYGRVSRSAALAFKARVALYEGTRQKFHNFGTPATHLELAVNAAQTVMTEGEHNLYPDYYKLFRMEGEGFANKECILPVVYGESLDNPIRWHNVIRVRTNGYVNVTRAMVENYLCVDGLPWDKSPLAVTPQQEATPWYWFRNKDPRMQASLFIDGEVYRNPADFFTWERGNNFTKYQCKKYSIMEGWVASRSFVDIHLLRYAEVLLNYAEAKFELNGSISDADLDKSINLLRTRAGVAHLSNSFVTQHGLDMREEIRRERAVELAQEGFRYDDIMRWKIAEDVLPKPILGAYYFANVYKVTKQARNAEGYIICESGEKRYFRPERDYLYPIPIREIGLSEGAIEQNPNWD